MQADWLSVEGVRDCMKDLRPARNSGRHEGIQYAEMGGKTLLSRGLAYFRDLFTETIPKYYSLRSFLPTCFSSPQSLLFC